MTSVSTRLALAVVATMAWSGELSFLIAHAWALGSLPRSIGWMLGYLTDWSALLVAVVCTAVALGWRRLSTPIWRGVATTATLLVGIMYGALGGWARLGADGFGNLISVSSLLAHIATPMAMAVAWLVFLPHGGLKWSAAARFMVFPFAYLGEMFARGLLGGGYPYPEVNVPAVGWPSALMFAGAVALLFFVIGLVLVAADKLLARQFPATLETRGR